MRLRRLGLAWSLAGGALVAAVLAPATTAFAASGPDGLDSSSYTTAAQGDRSDEGGGPSRNSHTLPHWTSSFTDPTNGLTYPFTMVGSDPRLGRSTTIATEIIPLKLIFDAGNQDLTVLNVPARNYYPTAQAVTMNGADNVADTIASPIFTPTDFPISNDPGVQYADAVMRAQFGKVGTGYHVKLGQPKVRHTVTIRVPQEHGVAVLNPLGVLVGRVDEAWFTARIQKLVRSMDISPSTLPIFLTQNVFAYNDQNFALCCGLGFHATVSPADQDGRSRESRGNQTVQTFAFAGYITPNSFPFFPAPFAGLSDINALSHEIAEWMENPFGTNPVQPALSPATGECLALLENADPLAGVWFPMPGNPNPASGGVWHPQDEAFLNWFARDGEDASLAPADGRYTYMGPLTTNMPRPPFIPPPGFAGFAQVAQTC